jgi:hypothetical protein
MRRSTNRAVGNAEKERYSGSRVIPAMKTFAFGSQINAHHAFFVLLHTADAPDAAGWNDYVAALKRALAESTKTVHVFAVTDGGGPDPTQRRSLAAAFESDRHGATTHVFTTSAFTRGIVTAFQWLARSRATAHHPNAFPSLCEQCQVPTPAVVDALLTLQQALPRVAILAELTRDSGEHRVATQATARIQSRRGGS